MLRRIGRVIFNLIPRWTWRVVVYAVFGSVLLFGGLILGLRYWVLPNAEGYRADAERMLSDATGHQVRIGALAGDWHGLRPQLVATDVRILDAKGEPALVLERVDNILSWTSLLHAELRFYAVAINRPDFALRRDREGRLWLGAIALDRGEGGGGLSDWLLRQRQIIIRDARVAWRDERLDAPELVLDKVQVRLYNDGERHRFGLHATPPPEVAAPVDVRADLSGGSVAELVAWSGTFYVSVDYVDIAAWRRWVPFPVDVPRGTGALRMWVDVAREEVRQVIADLR
ncbi:MAG: TIGR02099 family protein, partial [Alphaproteobacteria bacterium]|nr:TIGR02099 family protein [Alphaproteobacteria bacterium]